MPYLNSDDGFPEHPKVDALTDGAYRQLTRDICHWSRTGEVRTEFVQFLLDERLIRRAPRHWLPAALHALTPRHRAKIPAEVRQATYDRDGRACRDCGSTSDLTLDHIVPWSVGGSDEPHNLQTLCRRCNSRKGARA